MARPNILILAACLLLSPLMAPAQGRVEYCPAAPAADDAENALTTPGALLFSLSSSPAAASTVVRPGDVIQVLLSFFPIENSQCRIATQVTMSDTAGNLLFSGETEIGDNVGAVLQGVEKEFSTSDIPAGQEIVVLVDTQGPVTGCTTEELRSFAVVVQKLEPPTNADIIDASATDIGNYPIKRLEIKTPQFVPMKKIEAVIKPFKLDCPGGTKPLPFWQDEGIDSVNLIWDISDGGTSQAQAAESELLIFVTPHILTQSCRKSPGSAATFLPKVIVGADFIDDQGNKISLSGELDANNPAQSFPFPQGINGGRKQYAFRVEARSPGCVAAHGGVVNALLISRNGASTEVEQPLGVIVRKDVPPDPIRE